MGQRCKRCGSEEHIKNGLMRGKQRYHCKARGLNFTDTLPRGLPLQLKVTAVLLYVSGLSMHRTAKLLGVSTPSVMAWTLQFAKDHAPKPEPHGRAGPSGMIASSAGARGRDDPNRLTSRCRPECAVSRERS